MSSTCSRPRRNLFRWGTNGTGLLLLAGNAQAADSAARVAAALASPFGHLWGWTLVALLMATVVVLGIYTLRHCWSSRNRLFVEQRHPCASIVSADWPRVTIFVVARGEEAVIEDCLVHLMNVDYPADRMLVVPVNDRSKDRTRERIDQVATRYPERIQPFHRTGGQPGTAAALKDATETVGTEFIIVFDAGYLPSHGLIRRLMTPFFDPEVGAVMDRVAPQCGGTVGGIRLSALRAVGGWHSDVLAENTDLAYRLLLGGWKTVCQSRAQCHGAVPQNWAGRTRQIQRWTKGHNQAMWRHTAALLRQGDLRWRERLDGALLLGVCLVVPVLIIGWVVSLLLYFTVSVQWIAPAVLLLACMSHGALGHFAAFFESATAAHMDRSHGRIQRLAFNWLVFIVSAVAITRGTLEPMVLDRTAAPRPGAQQP